VTRTLRQRIAILATLAATLLLSACGNDGTPPSTPTPETSPTSVASPAPSGTPTVGDIADRIAAAWANVQSYRSVFTTTARQAPGTPGASPATVEVIDEVVPPDRKRRLSLADGAVVSEIISIAGRVYARGQEVPGLATPPADPDTWVRIDPAALDSESPIGRLYAGMAAEAAPPYSALSREQRMHDAVLIGEVEIEGRTCQRYRTADTTMTGERIEIVISLGDDDLPCAIETIAGGTVSRSTFTYNIPLTIEEPTAATPIALSPVP